MYRWTNNSQGYPDLKSFHWHNFPSNKAEIGITTLSYWFLAHLIESIRCAIAVES